MATNTVFNSKLSPRPTSSGSGRKLYFRQKGGRFRFPPPTRSRGCQRLVSMDVPTAWSDITSESDEGSTVLYASQNLAEFKDLDLPTTSGILFGVLNIDLSEIGVDADEFINIMLEYPPGDLKEICTSLGQYEYSSKNY